MTTKQILKGAGMALLIILLVIGNLAGANQAFDWMNGKEGKFQIIGLVLFFAMLIADVLIVRALAKPHKNGSTQIPK